MVAHRDSDRRPCRGDERLAQKNETGSKAVRFTEPANLNTGASRTPGERYPALDMVPTGARLRRWPCLTLDMTKSRPSPDPEQLKQFRQLMVMSTVGLVVVGLLVWAAFSQGVAKAIGLAIGTPILVVLLVLVLRQRQHQ